MSENVVIYRSRALLPLPHLILYIRSFRLVLSLPCDEPVCHRTPHRPSSSHRVIAFLSVSFSLCRGLLLSPPSSYISLTLFSSSCHNFRNALATRLSFTRSLARSVLVLSSALQFISSIKTRIYSESKGSLAKSAVTSFR